MRSLTNILKRVYADDNAAREELLAAIYDQLRQQARKHLSQEKQGGTLQSTALVHEVYLRLFVNENATQWQSRAHFFGAVSEVMRRILVERARARMALKRGGGAARCTTDVDMIESPSGFEQIVAIHDVLDKLSHTAPDATELVKLRFFVGYTIPEAAEIMSISPRKANQLWAYAKAWLAIELKGDV